MGRNDYVERYLSECIRVVQGLDRGVLTTFLRVLEDAIDQDRHVYLMGNGGSSSTASHFVNDFNKGLSDAVGAKSKFFCLNDNVPMMTAVANDIGYQEVFRHQLKGLLNAQDLVIVISGSGNSPNIINAINYAKSVGAYTVGLLGFDGGAVGKLIDLPVIVRSDSMQHVEDIHLLLDHMALSVLAQTMPRRHDDNADTAQG